jgi:lysophospholipase L1-like esterase
VTGWLKYFIEKTGCELIANVAVNGAWLNDKTGTIYDGNPLFNGTDNNVNNVLGNQVQKIINNGYEAPDIIMIAIGTNNGISITKDQIKSAYYDSSNELIPLENVDRKTSAGAYRWCLEKLHETYPNAIIFWCTPIMGYQSIRSADNAINYAESLRIATEYTGQIMIDTIRCGINGVNEKNGANGQYLVDGLHPNSNGAKKIGYYNASKVLPFLGNNFTLA